MNTEEIQKTISTAVAAGGGVVSVPAGRFVTGPFKLASGINLHLAKDAVILIDENWEKYPVAGGRYQDCISVQGGHDIEISGEGTIDGQGDPWWTDFRANKMTAAAIPDSDDNCNHVSIHGVTIMNSPMFHLA